MTTAMTTTTVIGVHVGHGACAVPERQSKQSRVSAGEHLDQREHP
jgi:hypothetical protein